MYSLNVSVPGRAAHFAPNLFLYLAPFDRTRDRRMLVYKRFEDVDPDRPRERLRHVLVGQSTFEVRVADV